MTKKLSIHGAALALAVAALAAAGVAAVFAPDSGDARVLAGARAALQGDGVLHARFLAPSGRVVAEEWLDRRSGATRREEASGRIIVQEALRVTQWETATPGVTWVAQLVDRNDPWLDAASQLLAARRQLDAGRARVVGSGSVRGRATWKVELDAGHGSHAGDVRVVADLDRETSLPLALTTVSGGESLTLSVETEELAGASPTLFASDRPWSIREARLRFDDLAAAAPFTVYTLGRSHGSLRAGAATFHEKTSPPGAPFAVQPELFLGYVGGGHYSEPRLVLAEQAAGTADADARLAAYRAQGTTRTATIAGAPRTVYLLDAETELVHFAAVVDGTLVKGRAAMPAERLLATLADLRPAR